MCLTSILTARTRGNLPTFNVCNRSIYRTSSASVPRSMGRGLLHFNETTVTYTAVENGSCLRVNSVYVNVNNSVVSPTFVRRCLNVEIRSISRIRVVHQVARNVCSGRRFRGTLT